ncbi:uracil permease-like protein [Coleophoma cylindrospora]|uniref:Uracil permease-like protein n=1 Tax=Coleophoma cylindrospora TaxID=1849047 RepID=A0A3D8RHE5_9HELO|nr:uracil permease-like protein [Coleophoma cylindrospora]
MLNQYSSPVNAKWQHLKRAFSSRQAFSDFIHVEPTLDNDGKVNFWINEDLKPTPPEKQTWSWFNYLVFYFGVGFGNWTLGSTMIGIGLSWWQSIVVIFVSQVIASVAIYFASRVGAVYHIGYPCVARSVFGMYGSYYYVGARAILAQIWYGVQMYSSARLLDCMLRAIFGTSYYNIPNYVPASQGINSRILLCFFLMWLAHLTLCSLRPYQLNKFFWAKTIIITPAVVGLFIFCMVHTKGNLGSMYGTTTTKGGFGWFFMYAINAGMGNNATYITNQPDMTRWSKTLWGCRWPQVIINPLTVTVSATFGILATAAINNAWGLELWNQWDLLGAIMDRYWSPGPRFAIALCSFAWTFYFLGVNISSNALPFGSDSTMLLPQFLTIPRGQWLATFVCWGLVPWKIEASATIFVSFLSGYGIFMASVSAVMMCEYYIITKGNLFISHLYTGTKENKHYYYNKGWNIQALIAYVCGVAVPFPGFCGTLGANVSQAATDIGHLGWLLSFTISFILYYIICTFWPTENQKIIKEMGLGWEQMANAPETVDALTPEPVEEIAVLGAEKV